MGFCYGTRLAVSALGFIGCYGLGQMLDVSLNPFQDLTGTVGHGDVTASSGGDEPSR